MPEADLPTSWEAWAVLARTALEPGPAILPEQLLLVRDLEGRLVRSMEPPEGIIARPGAVLILLYPDGADLRLPLTVRSDRLPNHRGEVSLPGGATDPQDNSPAATALRECWEEMGIAPGEAAVAQTILDAETTLVQRAEARGYALARAGERRAVVDHDADAMDLTLRLDTGPLVRFGAITVAGVDEVERDFVEKRLPWRPGEVITSERLAEGHEILQVKVGMNDDGPFRYDVN